MLPGQVISPKTMIMPVLAAVSAKPRWERAAAVAVAVALSRTTIGHKSQKDTKSTWPPGPPGRTSCEYGQPLVSPAPRGRKEREGGAHDRVSTWGDGATRAAGGKGREEEGWLVKFGLLPAKKRVYG